jgi:hypothetical protein
MSFARKGKEQNSMKQKMENDTDRFGLKMK